ncbi:flavin reductase family protein [Thalassotalea marina]|uniref:Flavin oxidoreductase n=1 Tax=Thalassotalea marina TaxID=1673741 RepID=A0A919BS31_9GAMM|nr:flavin reductase [Thalassotalea marina]GHG06362.1 flavin oxidoreductase [Thalassotalea marina]
MNNLLQHISRQQLDSFEQRYRAKLVNSLSGFKSANLIGTKCKAGIENLSIVSSVFHLGANPPLVGMINRPDTVRRDTLSNIKANQEFSINHVNAKIWQQAHQCSARYDKTISEFEAVGLKPQYINNFNCPFVHESEVKYGVSLIEIVDIKHNGTTMIVGEIQDIFVNEKALLDDGFIDIELLETIAVSSLDSYHLTTKLGRLAYAKPERAVTPLQGI